MGQDQIGRGDDFPAEGEQIQINEAWFVEDFFGEASHLFFEGLQLGEQGARGFGGARNQGGHGVDKKGRTGRAIHRLGFAQGRTEKRVVGKGLEEGEGAEDVLACIAQVGTEGDEGDCGLRNGTTVGGTARGAIADCGLRSRLRLASA